MILVSEITKLLLTLVTLVVTILTFYSAFYYSFSVVLALGALTSLTWIASFSTIVKQDDNTHY